MAAFKTWLRVKIGLYERDLRRRIREAREVGDLEELSALEFEEDFFYGGAQLKEQKRLLAKARKLGVPVPHRSNVEDKSWYENPMLGAWFLTFDGWRSVRDGVREEEKHKREVLRDHVAIWGGMITALVALGSVLTSLVLVLKD